MAFHTALAGIGNEVDALLVAATIAPRTRPGTLVAVGGFDGAGGGSVGEGDGAVGADLPEVPEPVAVVADAVLEAAVREPADVINVVLDQIIVELALEGVSAVVVFESALGTGCGREEKLQRRCSTEDEEGMFHQCYAVLK